MRYGVVTLIGGRFFPWATLTVNVIGSLLMGIAFVLVVEKAHIDPIWRPLLMTGFLGAFTTFSAFSLETWQLAERGEWVAVASYIVASVLLSIMALVVGIVLTRNFA